MKKGIALVLGLFTALLLFLPGTAQAAAEPCNNELYTLGSQDACVTQIQSALQNRVDRNLPTDGTYGPRTRRTVAAFQQQAGLTPDGVAGPATLQALGLTGAGGASRVQVAKRLLQSGKVDFWTTHISGVKDDANALANIKATAAGKTAQRSAYENAPGGETQLSEQMLDAMAQLARKYDFAVSEITGGSHSKNSKHYRGVAFDVSHINGRMVTSQNPDWQAFKRDAQAMGAFVLGPGDPGHATHLHIQF